MTSKALFEGLIYGGRFAFQNRLGLYLEGNLGLKIDWASLLLSVTCSHGGWLLLECSATGIGFNGAETNCGIALILRILLMNSCDT